MKFTVSNNIQAFYGTELQVENVRDINLKIRF